MKAPEVAALPSRRLRCCVLLVGCALGCVSSFGPRTHAGPPSAAVKANSEQAADAWGLSSDDFGTQRILKARYQDAEQSGSLKLVLRLQDRHRFSLQGSDTFNRSWFRLAVDGDLAVFSDLRAKTYCVLEGEVELRAVPLGPLPFDALPALLLGRLPVAAATKVEHESVGVAEVQLGFHDHRGRRWSARLKNGELVSWILWQEGEPEVYWSTSGPESFLSARSERLQLRWQTNKHESLQQAPAAAEPPSGFVEDCSSSDG